MTMRTKTITGMMVPPPITNDINKGRKGSMMRNTPKNVAYVVATAPPTVLQVVDARIAFMPTVEHQCQSNQTMDDQPSKADTTQQLQDSQHRHPSQEYPQHRHQPAHHLAQDNLSWCQIGGEQQ